MMKRKFLFISLIVSPLILSGCSFSDIIDINPVSKVEIQDLTEQYAYGDIYSQEQQLSILVTYKNSSRAPEYVSISDVTLSLFVDDVEQGYTSAIENRGGAGKFTISVTYSKIQSNTLTYDLLNEHIYVESIEIAGVDKANTFESVNLSMIVTPSNHTKKVTVSASDPSTADVTLNNDTLVVRGKKPGEVDIIASSPKAGGGTVSATHHMTFLTETGMVNAKQTYNDFIKNNVFNVSSCPLTGSPKLLVIPVWFNDSNSFINTSKKEAVRSDIEKAYFGTTADTGWNSVASYYKEESKGILHLTGTVSDWYECGISYRTAGRPNYDTADLVERAVTWYFTNNPSDSRSNYDSDGDNVLDGVMLIYAAPDHRALADDSYSNLWAFCYWIQPDPIPSGIYPNVYFWASYDFMYGSNVVYSRTGNSRYYSGDTLHCTIDAHTYIHEMGHVFGLEDYYDYSDNSYFPAGAFSMQDYNIGGHDPFSVFAFGWASAYLPTSSDTITISNFQDNHDMIILSPEFNAYDSPFDEYLILELYTPTGLNTLDSTYKYLNQFTGPTQAGIRVWHVDSRLATPTNSIGSSYTLAGSNVKQGADWGITHALSNTYEDGTEYTADYLSKMGRGYYDYNILQFIRNNKTETYHPTSYMTNDDLFYKGDTFTMSSFSSQFVKGTKLNNGKDLGWSFTVNDIALVNGQYTASIQVTKL